MPAKPFDPENIEKYVLRKGLFVVLAVRIFYGSIFGAIVYFMYFALLPNDNAFAISATVLGIISLIGIKSMARFSSALDAIIEIGKLEMEISDDKNLELLKSAWEKNQKIDETIMEIKNIFKY